MAKPRDQRRLARDIAAARGFVAAFVPLIALLMRDRPEDLGLAPYGGGGFRPAPALDGNPLTLAFRALGDSARSRAFLADRRQLFCLRRLDHGLIGTHLIPACVDHGLPRSPGRVFLAATGVFSFLGGTLSGWLSDRVDNRLLLACITDCAASPCSICPSPSTCRFTGCRCSRYSTARLDRRGPADRSAVEPGGRNRENRDYGRVDHGHPSGRRGLGRLSGRSAADLFGTYLEAFLFAGLLCFARRRWRCRSGPAGGVPSRAEPVPAA